MKTKTDYSVTLGKVKNEIFMKYPNLVFSAALKEYIKLQDRIIDIAEDRERKEAACKKKNVAALWSLINSQLSNTN